MMSLLVSGGSVGGLARATAYLFVAANWQTAG
jgi:hypothetical protein